MRKTWMIFLAAALCMPLAANAQDVYDTEYYGTGSSWRAPTIGVMAEVGVNDYNRDLNNEINVGVGYGARVDLSPMRNLGLEVAYQGGVNDLNDNISRDGSLITNAVGGNLRVNLVPPQRDLPGGIRPFVLGGAFYQRIDTHNFTPGLRDTNAFALPVGAGIEANIGHRFLVGGRFTYNFLFNEVDNLGGQTDNWLASVALGTRFGH